MKLMVLDGNSIINRSFYGVRPLSTKDGFFTNAIFGFLNILEKLRTEETPDALCVAFDLKGPTFRHLRYDGYKATRHPMPEELAMQLPVMKQVLTAMRIPIFSCQGWEADDVIGTIGRRCGDSGWDCVIVTGDRDSLQLIDEHVHVKLIVTKQAQTTSTEYDEALFTREYGFAPIRLIDLKSLMGDSSDNIPGVAGIGPKTATQLLLDYGTLDGVYAHLDQIKEKLRAKLEADRQSAYLSYELATIRCEAPIEFSPDDCKVQEPDNDALYALFSQLEFTRLIQRYGLHAPQARVPVRTGTCQVNTVKDASQADEALRRLADAPFAAVLTSEDLSEGYAARQDAADDTAEVCVFSSQELGAAYLPVLHRLFSGQIRKVTHDCKTLMRELLGLGIDPDGFCFDTALAAYLLDATRGNYELSSLAEQYLSYSLPAPDGKTEDGTDACRARLTACVSAVMQLYGVLEPLLQQQSMQTLYETIELPLCRVLADMEHCGVLVDQMALISFGNMLTERIQSAEELIYSYADGPFNINSTRQLGELLFDRLGLPAYKKTKSGYSTNADVLEKLRGRHPIIEAILDYRMLTKLKSTYADGLVKQIAEDGRIHTTFQNMVTATGRLSSTDPNLQNIPVRTELGSEIRKMFIPDEGCVFVDADYSQIELRVLSHIADDKAMQDAFRSGLDIHTATAAQVFHVEAQDVTPLMRRHAKAVNFGIVYGISEFSLSEDIGVSRAEAKRYIQSYLDHYPGVKAYMHDIVEQAKRDGFVTTLFGRRRMLPELKSSNFNTRSFGERVALNTPIQGTAADIMKLAMLRVDKALKKQKLHAKLVLQVHDELVVECPLAEAQHVQQTLKREMESVAEMKVPLLAEAKTGESWYAAK